MGQPLAETTRALIAQLGVDVTKLVLQVHAVEVAGRKLVARATERGQFLAKYVQLPAGCLVAMEASGGAHHWAQHSARLRK